MGFFDLFRKRGPDEGTEVNPEAEKLKPYGGMQVEVTTLQGKELFIARLDNLQGTTAQLRQYSDADSSAEGESAGRIQIRGYSIEEEKAIYLEGSLLPKSERVWQVEDLKLLKKENDRAFFRVDTDLEASVRSVGKIEVKEGLCRLLNISVGGVCIRSAIQYHEKERLMLNVKWMEENDVSFLLCKVLRVSKKEDDQFEYGCCFLELEETDRQKVAQTVFKLQREPALRKSEETQQEQKVPGSKT